MTGANRWADEPEFRSTPCRMGQHARCTDSAPRDSGVPGVHHLVCACPCHPTPPGPAAPLAAPAASGDPWYRLCWRARPEEFPVPTVAYGVLIGRNVPALLRGMRGCLSPSAFHDPAHVQALADTEDGWTYRTAPLAVHTHRFPAPRDGGPPLPGGPRRKEAR